MMAQNIKIISTNGQITLRGPVKSGQEKDAIVSDVQGVSGVDGIAGVDGIDDRMEVVKR